MRYVISGDNLQIMPVNEKLQGYSAQEWLRDKAQRQRRTADGRFLAKRSTARRHAPSTPNAPSTQDTPSTQGFQRFFVLAKALPSRTAQ